MKMNLMTVGLMLLLGTTASWAQMAHNIRQLKDLGCELVDSSLMETVAKACRYSMNRGKTVGVFGGSLSVNKESQAAKLMWRQYLNLSVTDYGHGGYGFSSLQGSILDQVNAAKPHDIYILWASTNDYTNNREPGSAQDYTEADGFDERKLVTQCGGMNYCIRKLRHINPRAKIYIFGSLKYWQRSEGEGTGSEAVNKLGVPFSRYIDLQRQVAEQQGVLFFDQYSIPVVTEQTKDRFYMSDNLHMTYDGYANVGVYQLHFLATEKPVKDKRK